MARLTFNYLTLWCNLQKYDMFCVAGTFPIDLAKTRLQVQGQVGSKYREIRYRGMLHAIVRIAREEGPRALYSGSVCWMHALLCVYTIPVVLTTYNWRYSLFTVVLCAAYLLNVHTSSFVCTSFVTALTTYINSTQRRGVIPVSQLYMYSLYTDTLVFFSSYMLFNVFFWVLHHSIMPVKPSELL